MARGAVGRGFEIGVAEAAIAAARQQDLVADLVEIGQQRFAILFVDLGADRNFQDQVFAAGAVAVLAHAVAAALRLVVLQIAVIDQGIQPVHRARDHVAAMAAVAAIGAAELDEFFAPERHAAVTAGAGLNVDLGFVEEFHGVSYRAARLPLHALTACSRECGAHICALSLRERHGHQHPACGNCSGVARKDLVTKRR